MHHNENKDWLDDDFKLGDPFILSESDYETVMRVLANPPKPTQFLIDLMKAK